jgi:subtilisin family serine protease
VQESFVGRVAIRGRPIRKRGRSLAKTRIATAGLLLATALGCTMAAGLAPAHAADGPQPLPGPTPSATPSATPSPTPAATPTPTATPTPKPAAEGPVRPYSGDVDPRWGNIRTFWGDSSPLWGNIRTFWGDQNPYEGDLTAFWGNIRTFNDGTNSTDLSPLWGNIRTFAGDLGGQWGNIRTFWGNIRTFGEAPGDYATLTAMLGNMVNTSESFWGDAVKAQTGKTFRTAFADPLLARYGIRLDDPASLGALSVDQRERFFLDWYDGLMNYSGADHVDHWMSAVKWSPAITQTIGEGKRSVIGLLDFTVTGDTANNIVRYGGISTFTNGHGAAVASLMVDPHDGRGVMGIAPMASVVAYNPFDATGTAGWADIKNGVLMLARNNASIINMSLGVPGYTLHPGWNDVFSDLSVAAATRGAVFVTAAGNDGITQTQNIPWNFATNPNLIVVGSVDPAGKISSFSNRPGNACLTTLGLCLRGNELMNRFITAPGEMILVSDGQGGVTRMSGTSFAAPLVSGTIALLHDRWPWLSNYPKETVDIILRSARDVGAPGVDPVYGWGILDVTAALSPLNFNAVRWYTYKDGKIAPEQANKIRDPKEVAKWEAKGMFFYAYEDIGASFRDFAIPVSTKLVGQTALSSTGAQEYLQQYIYSRFMAWVNAGRPGSSGPGPAGPGFAAFGTPRFTSFVPNDGGLDMSVSVAPRTRAIGFRQSGVPYQSALRIDGPDARYSITFGEGDGATMMADTSFAAASDADPYSGGANPVLGWASGGAFLETRVQLDDRWSLSAGVTQRTLKRDVKALDALSQVALGAIDPFQAGAQTLALAYRDGPVKLTGTYTRLHEGNSMLGLQSLDPADFAGGTTTDGVTFGTELALGDTLSLASSATVSRTRAGGDQQIAVSPAGLISSAWQVGLSKAGVFGHDRLRLTAAQPMHLERGSVDLTTVQVVDRQTGELGPVTQRFALGIPARQYVGELTYGHSLLDGQGEVSLFGRAVLGGQQSAQLPRLIAGGGFRLGF